MKYRIRYEINDGEYEAFMYVDAENLVQNGLNGVVADGVKIQLDENITDIIEVT